MELIKEWLPKLIIGALLGVGIQYYYNGGPDRAQLTEDLERCKDFRNNP